ncbi:undecaprenyl-phosphate glucose phosphotransferase [Candidatus Poribacteria bacterium]|nr:undecaprenyl-phosphate glucose phosphotransferase [Candidatus Poribacteria bacterium]
MSNKTLDQLLTVFTLLLDVCFISASVFVAYWLRFESGWLDGVAIHKGAPPPLDYYFQLIPLMGFIWILVLRGIGLYRIEGRITLETVASISKTGVIASIATLGAIFFIYHNHQYSRWVMILSCVLSVILLSLNRLVIQRFKEAIQQLGVGISRVAVVGFNTTTQQLIHSFEEKTSSGYQFVGVLLGGLPPSQPISHRILGEFTEIRSLVQKYRIDELFITSPAISHTEILQIVDVCEGLSVRLHLLPDFYEVMIGRTRVADFDGIPVVRLKELPLQGWRGMIKRGMDILLSSIALIVCSPLMLSIAVAVKLSSPGRVIFRQERVGRDGTPFYIYKFRSMRQDAEVGVGHVWASKDDPRQTWLGRFLRRWCLDELPQFFNVFKGDMSLVGPRPEMSGLIDDFSKSIPHYLDRHRVKCGLTGWAQVNGLRGNTSLEERIRYDLYYIENWSIGFDIKILLKTLWSIKRAPQRDTEG